MGAKNPKNKGGIFYPDLQNEEIIAVFTVLGIKEN